MNCLFCKTNTSNPKFCSQSCAAKYNNTLIPKRERKIRLCKYCNKDITYEYDSIGGGNNRSVCDECIGKKLNKIKELSFNLNKICYNDKCDQSIPDHKKFCCTKCQNAFLNRNKRKKLKELSVKYKGGKCSICGYDKCIAALEFHHVNPDEKDFQLNSLYKSWEKIQPELDKCILLCANCHREKHNI